MGEINNARYWVGICYPENMIDDWKDVIGDYLEYPYAYCVHDKDHLGTYKPKRKKDDQRQRKLHVHVFLAFPNTTTKKHAENIFNKLSAEGKKCCPGAEAVINPKNKYNYLIHDTETAKKQGKYLYPKEERIEGNNFDIGAYIQITTKDLRNIKRELGNLIRDLRITNFIDFYNEVENNFDDQYFEVMSNNSSFFDKLIKGNYHKFMEYEKEEAKNYE